MYVDGDFSTFLCSSSIKEDKTHLLMLKCGSGRVNLYFSKYYFLYSLFPFNICLFTSLF